MKSDLEKHVDRLLAWDVELQPVKDSLNAVRSRPLLPAAQAFLTTLENSAALRDMPFAVAAHGVGLFDWTVQFIRGALKEPLEGKCPFTTDENELSRRASDLLAVARKDPRYAKESGKRIVDVLVQSMSLDVFRRSARVLLLAESSLLWTGFECLSKDLWVAALNSSAVPLGQRALRSLTDEQDTSDGVSRKSVQVGILARHGFDLRDALGTILAGKFKFSDPECIRKAYVAAFGHAEKFDAILEVDQLKRLAATRHVIAHRGGVVDERYRQVTGSTQSLGEPLDIDAKMVEEFADVTVEAGAALIDQVDAVLHECRKKPTSAE